MVTMIEVLDEQISACVRAARAQGWNGDERDYRHTAEDCETIADAMDAAGLTVEIQNRRSLTSIHDAAQLQDERGAL